MRPKADFGERARAVLVTFAVTVLLLLPLPASLAALAQGELFQIGKDKLAHCALFALLAWTWSAVAGLGSVRDIAGFRPARAAALFAALLAWGGAIELVQAWSGWRRGEWSDLAADGLGIAAAMAARALRPVGGARVSAGG